MAKSTRIGRRLFMQAASTVAAMPAAEYARATGANNRIGLGLIGYGLIAKTHVTAFRQCPEAEFVAVSDCHRLRCAEGVQAVGGKAAAYADFRNLLDDRSVHAVIVATPDHWHAPMAMLACAAGKDVYVEKPLTLFVREGEWLETVATRTKRVVQIGTQQRSGPHYRMTRDRIRSGAIGTVTSVRMSSVRNVWPGFGRPPDTPPPADLNWDLWLGPAPWRPYNPLRGLYHFRWFWDTSGGQMTNLGAHHLDIVDWVLGLDRMKAVASFGGRFALTDSGETPDTQDALFDCGTYTASITIREAARGERPDRGLVFHGTKGSLAIDRRGFTVTPDPDLPPVNQIPGVKEGHPSGGPVAVPVTGEPKPRTAALADDTGDSMAQYLAHAKDFLACIRTRQVPISNLASAQRTATACHLANLSLRLGRSLRWDWDKRECPADREANSHLVRPYRKPWDRVIQALGVG